MGQQKILPRDLLIAAKGRERCPQGPEILGLCKEGSDLPTTGNVPGIYLQRRLEMALRCSTDMALNIPTPASTKQVKEFLGSKRFYHLWIPGFAKLAKPLYEATKEEQDLIEERTDRGI